MEECTLTLPYPPSVNHYKKVGRLTTTASGKLYQKRYNSPETKVFFWLVWSAVKLKGPQTFATASISMEVDVYPPDRRKRDLDGILKVLLDSLQQAGVYDDDFQIARLLVTRKTIIKEGQVIVRIKLL